jgi:predicted nucleic acid-binding Zn ribbon protein
MKNDQSIKEVLQSWLKDEKIKRKTMEAKLIIHWAEITGPLISKYTREIKIDGKVLVIKVESAPLKQELLIGKDLLLKNVNAFLEERYLTDIRIL